MLDALQQTTGSVSSRLGEVLLLVLLPFFREDVAILTGGLLVVERGLPPFVAFVSLYAGVIASDFALFGLGRLASRSAEIRRILLTPRAERVGLWLRHHIPAAMIVARIVPGVIFPVYVGLGLLGVRTRVFGPLTMATALVYVPVLLWLVIRFGEDALSGQGYWVWILAAAAMVLLTAQWARNPPWALLLRVGGSGLGGLVRRPAAAQPEGPSHLGLPALKGLVARIGLAEKIPTQLFYAPLALHWLWLAIRFRSLSLPTLVNPMIEVGGLWGESKQVYLDMVTGENRRWLARYATMLRGAEAEAEGGRAVALAEAAGLGFPLVAKPDIGWQGYGVRPVADAADLRAYVAAFPEAATLMLQEMVPWEAEAGVFYVRHPGEAEGRVVALTYRYFPHVTGDGAHSVHDLILGDERAAWKAGLHLGLDGSHAGLPAEVLDSVPAAGAVVRLAFIGSIRVGGLYRDAAAHITPALSARFDAISRSMPEFHYGRYDIRFASVAALEAGEDFRIIEINGAGSESISAWDPGTPLRAVYRRLLAHQRMLFEIGAANRARGFHTPGFRAILRAAWKQRRLIRRYPASG